MYISKSCETPRTILEVASYQMKHYYCKTFGYRSDLNYITYVYSLVFLNQWTWTYVTVLNCKKKGITVAYLIVWSSSLNIRSSYSLCWFCSALCGQNKSNIVFSEQEWSHHRRNKKAWQIWNIAVITILVIQLLKPRKNMDDSKATSRHC